MSKCKMVRDGDGWSCNRCSAAWATLLPEPECLRTPLPAVGPELDKALDDFVADKPKDIMR